MEAPRGDLEFCVRTCDGRDEPWNHVDSGLSLEDLAGVFQAALSPEEGASRPRVAVARRLADSPPALLVCVSAPESGAAHSAAALREWRDRVLAGDFDAAATRGLHDILVPRGGVGDMKLAKVVIRADRSEFVEQYEASSLALRSLTPHQLEKVRECGLLGGGIGAEGVHLRAPAGAGKTFVALQSALDELRCGGSALVLFVALNAPLAHFAASWLARRVEGRGRRRLLRRFHVLCEPFAFGPRCVIVRDNRVCLRPLQLRSEADGRLEYSLVVVDEAHHLYSNEAAHGAIEAYVTTERTRQLLLSDISQSLGRNVMYPEGLRDVVLTEVVRCSKRIVAGAMAFQLGGEEKLLTKCHHDATGPPLQSFLFDLPSKGTGGDACPSAFQVYALHTLRALDHVVSAFPGLSLHNRLAIVVPDGDFLEKFRPELLSALAARFPGRPFRLVDAAVASADLGTSQAADCEASDGTASGGSTSNDSREGMEAAEAVEWLVYDTVQQVDGLERLIVVGVGLDSTISSEEVVGDEGASVLETRSMLYRVVTRAHLMFLVVNEFLRGGWLEFLGSVRLRDDEAFDRVAELRRSEACAVEGVILTELTSAVAAAAREGKTHLDERALFAIAADAAKLRERGQSLDAAVAASLHAWQQAAEHVRVAFRLAAAPLGLDTSADAVRSLECVTTLALHRDEIINLPASALEALKKLCEKLRNSKVEAALDAAASAVGQKVSPQVVTALRARVLVGSERGERIEEAAEAALMAWLHVESLTGHALRVAMEAKQLEPTQEAEQTLLTAAAVGAFQGDTPERAVEAAILKWRREENERLVSSAVAAALAAAATQPVCRTGCRVRVVGLRMRPFLNGTLGQAENFIAAKRRWGVLLDGSVAPMALKPENLKAEPHELAQPPALEEAAGKLFDIVRANLEEGDGHAAHVAVAAAIRWRVLEAQASSAIVVEAQARQLQLNEDAIRGLVATVVESWWQVADAAESLAQTVTAAVGDWEQRDRTQQQEAAEIAAALEAAAHSKRLLLTDAATASLQRRVAIALRRGVELTTAVDTAMREWHEQVVRRQVQQTVWDPSGNETRKVTGVVRFMPFKQRDSERFDYALLSWVFPLLPFHGLGVLACVCKRWRSAAEDPSWKPDLIAYAWGARDVNGLAADCPRPTLLDFSLARNVVRIACADAATFALTDIGDVWFWGRSWLVDQVEDSPEPTRLRELRDVVSVAACPPGYFHMRTYLRGYSCAATTRDGALFTWGLNTCGQLLHHDRHVVRPRRVVEECEAWRPLTERALSVACGGDFLALSVQRPARGPSADGTSVSAPTTSVLTVGLFCLGRGSPHRLHEWEALRGVPLRQLAAGSFHCCALATRGDLYTFGDEWGQDHSNGNLLGQGSERRDEPDESQVGPYVQKPRRLVADGLGPVAEVACSTYTTIAITQDGRVFSWGDSDGDALGHEHVQCHVPRWVASLRWQRVSHGSVAYTNAAVATDEGRVFVWGGNMWEGGIAEGRNTDVPTEVQWAHTAVPSCYRCSSVALAHRHGYLIFQKQP